MRLVTAVRVAVAVLVVAAVPSVPASGGMPGANRPVAADNGRRAGAVGVGGLSVDEPVRRRSDAPGMLGIPGIVLDAYRNAAMQTGATDPGCRLTWQMLAGVGKVESDHARGGAVTKHGDAVRPVLGPLLDGRRYAQIRDTDDGLLDRDGTWDRAVGPMQFIPSSWQVYASDGNGDGVADPQNVYDAALATARYLCEGARDLSRRMELATALYSYNHSLAYVRTVLAWIDAYTAGRARPDGVPDLRALGLSPPAAPVPTGPPMAEPAPRAPRGGPDGSAPDAGPDPVDPGVTGPGATDPGAVGTQPPKPARPTDPTTPDKPGPGEDGSGPREGGSGPRGTVPSPSDSAAPMPEGTTPGRGEADDAPPTRSPRPRPTGPASTPARPTPGPSDPTTPGPAPTCATTPTPDPTSANPTPTPSPTTPPTTPSSASTPTPTTPTPTPTPGPTTPGPTTPGPTTPGPTTPGPTTPSPTPTVDPCVRPSDDTPKTTREWVALLQAFRLLLAGRYDEARLDLGQ
jgi:hypothetical protein